MQRAKAAAAQGDEAIKEQKGRVGKTEAGGVYWNFVYHRNECV